MPSPDRPEVRWIPQEELLLDPTNPRLAGSHVTHGDQGEILEWLWRNKSVDELIDSMAANGYWSHEELFAVEEGGKYVVIEGNRRLAAVRILLDQNLRRDLGLRDVRLPSPEKRVTLLNLPVIVRSRREIWDYIGFKHVNGPQVWDSIAKAEYIHRVHSEFGIELDQIARTIGDRHETVQRLYRGYLVLRQAEEKGLFDSEDRYNKKFSFSHLWTALGYTSIRNFLGLGPEDLERPNPVAETHLPKLQELMHWLFGSRQKEIEPTVKRQNPDLRLLAEALESPRSIDFLRAQLPLTAAIDAKRGDERLFREALTLAEENLRNAKRYVATGYHGEAELLQTAGYVATVARSLQREMSETQQSRENRV